MDPDYRAAHGPEGGSSKRARAGARRGRRFKLASSPWGARCVGRRCSSPANRLDADKHPCLRGKRDQARRVRPNFSEPALSPKEKSVRGGYCRLGQ
jgi:hypothetical protein